MFLFYQHYIQLVRRFSVVLLLLDGGNALPNICKCAMQLTRWSTVNSTVNFSVTRICLQ